MRNYDDPDYKRWRKNVQKRDKHTCQWPNCKSRKKIHAHHIYKWSDFPGLRYHPSNDICLCKIHHDFIKNNEESYCGYFMTIVKNQNHET